nr:MAG TPA: hypothetical protein [Caudoviricetes sp.]
MTSDALKFINNTLEQAGINYELGEWTSDIVYPYFVGDYQEVEPVSESGEDETAFRLTGFAKGSGDALLALEEVKEKIRKLFNPIEGKLAATENHSVVAVFYAGASNNIPTGVAELKKIQINLAVKEWRVYK